MLRPVGREVVRRGEDAQRVERRQPVVLGLGGGNARLDQNARRQVGELQHPVGRDGGGGGVLVGVGRVEVPLGHAVVGRRVRQPPVGGLGGGRGVEGGPVGVGVERRQLAEAQDRPRLPARPRAVVGVALVRLLRDEVARLAVEVNPLGRAAVGTHVVAGDRLGVAAGAVAVKLRQVRIARVEQAGGLVQDEHVVVLVDQHAVRGARVAALALAPRRLVAAGGLAPQRLLGGGGGEDVGPRLVDVRPLDSAALVVAQHLDRRRHEPVAAVAGGRGRALHHRERAVERRSPPLPIGVVLGDRPRHPRREARRPRRRSGHLPLPRGLVRVLDERVVREAGVERLVHLGAREADGVAQRVAGERSGIVRENLGEEELAGVAGAVGTRPEREPAVEHVDHGVELGEVGVRLAGGRDGGTLDLVGKRLAKAVDHQPDGVRAGRDLHLPRVHVGRPRARRSRV